MRGSMNMAIICRTLINHVDGENVGSAVKRKLFCNKSSHWDENISDMSKPVWKSIVKRQIKYYVFNCLLDGCHSNRKTGLLRYNKFKLVDYLTELDPPIASFNQS